MNRLTGILCSALLLLAAVCPALELDPSLIADWGPPTTADSLAHELRLARWTEDAATFEQARARLWEHHPHHDAALAETALWFRDRRLLHRLQQAHASGRLDALLPLPDLGPADADFLAGYALMLAGRYRTGRDLLREVTDQHPWALDQLFQAELFLADDPATIQDAYAAAAGDGQAAVELASRLLDQRPLSLTGDHTAAVLAVLDQRPPRPQLAGPVAAARARQQLQARPHSLAEVAAVLDGLRAEHPQTAAVFLDDLIGTARAWHGAGALLAIYQQRANWQPPERRARAEAWLLIGDGRPLAAYRRLLPLTASGTPPPEVLDVAPRWHPDAVEVERWARARVTEGLSASWAQAAAILRDRGHPDAADSVRALAAYEAPLKADLERARRLTGTEPAAAAALARRWTDVLGLQAAAHRLVHLAARRGDPAATDSLLAAWGPAATSTLTWQALEGTAAAGDTTRLRELAHRTVTTLPDHGPLIMHAASLCAQRGAVATAGRLHDHLAGLDHPPRDLFVLQIDIAIERGDPDTAREALVAHLATDPRGAGDLLRVPVWAEGAGWSELADQALATLRSEAPDALAVRLASGRTLTRRGEHRAARDVLAPLAESWPGRPQVRQALVAAGGEVEAYREPDGFVTATSFGGLDGDYAATGWILERLATEEEFPDEDLLVLRDRHTYHLASREDLRRRRHLTVQLLSAAAVEGYETVRVTFDADQGQPRVLSARVITPAGEVREVPRASILITAPEGRSADVSDVRDLVIPFSGVTEGAVVDYCIEEEMPSFLDLGQAFEYYFGFGSPQREELLEVILADGVAAHLHDAHAPVAATRHELPGATLLRWRVTDTEPVWFADQTPLTEVLAERVGVTTYDDWDRLASYYGEAFWPQATADSELCERAAELTAGAGDDRERAARLYQHLQADVRNVGIELGDGRFVPTPATEVLARGYGDCKDKVATLAALLDCLDIACEPVLVGVRPDLPPEKDFPYSGRFDHLLAYLPDVDGGVFCDPTLGGACLTSLSGDVFGVTGLRIERDGDGHLVELPERSLATPLIDLEVDLHPEPGGHLRAEVVAQVRGDMAADVQPALDRPDTSMQRYLVDLITGNRFGDSTRLIRWERRERGCDWFELRAVLRDSAWASPDAHDASAIWVAATDRDLNLPSPDDRAHGTELDTPRRLRARIRAHAGAGWRVTDVHAPMRVRAPDYRGEVRVEVREKDGHRWLEIRREERYGARAYSAEDYARLHDQVLSYRLATYQPIRYQRVGDPERIAQLRAYGRDHPDDHDFAVQAAMQILGGDLGGRGEAGQQRRDIARELLAGELGSARPRPLACLLGAMVAAEDDRYLLADSLVTRGLTTAPDDVYLLSLAADLQRELGDEDAVTEHLRAIQQHQGGPAIGYALVGQYLRQGEDDLARQQAERLALLTAEVDSARLAITRLEGYVASDRHAVAESLLARTEHLLAPLGRQLFRADIRARQRRWDAAIAAIADVQNERPLDIHLNNNLAWYLACAGRDLDRAEYLVRMSLALTDEASLDNTLAVVLLQQGRLDEARDMLARLMADERPPVRVTNGYFLGLCHWRDGDREEAVALWRELDALQVQDEFGTVITETLAAVAAGEDPAWLYLRPPEGQRHAGR